jgi:hypothetical protein
LAAKLIARKNGTRWEYRDKLLRELEDIEGCTVTEYAFVPEGFLDFSTLPQPTEGEGLYARDLRARKGAIVKERANAIANADVIPLSLAQTLSQKASTTEKERHQISKAFLGEELPELPLTGEFVYERVLKDRRKWLNGAKLLHLVEFDDYCHHLDRKHLIGKIKEFCLGDVNMASIRTNSHRVKLIKDCGILKLIGYNSDDPPELSQDSPEVKAFCEKAYFYRHRFKRCFGLTISKDLSPMQMVQAIAQLLSLRLACTRREPSGNRMRYYTFNPGQLIIPDRVAVVRSLEIKRKKAMGEDARKPDRITTSTNPPPTKKEYIDIGAGGPIELLPNTA